MENPWKIHEKSWKIIENPWKILGNSWKIMSIFQGIILRYDGECGCGIFIQSLSGYSGY
jgi:hypothetical protein